MGYTEAFVIGGEVETLIVSVETQNKSVAARHHDGSYVHGIPTVQVEQFIDANGEDRIQWFT